MHRPQCSQQAPDPCSSWQDNLGAGADCQVRWEGMAVEQAGRMLGIGCSQQEEQRHSPDNWGSLFVRMAVEG